MGSTARSRVFGIIRLFLANPRHRLRTVTFSNWALKCLCSRFPSLDILGVGDRESKEEVSGKPISWSQRTQIYWLSTDTISLKRFSLQLRLVPELDDFFLNDVGLQLQSGLECFQGCGIHQLSGKSVLILHHLHCKKISSCMNLPLFSLKPLPWVLPQQNLLKVSLHLS